MSPSGSLSATGYTPPELSQANVAVAQQAEVEGPPRNRQSSVPP